MIVLYFRKSSKSMKPISEDENEWLICLLWLRSALWNSELLRYYTLTSNEYVSNMQVWFKHSSGAGSPMECSLVTAMGPYRDSNVQSLATG